MTAKCHPAETVWGEGHGGVPAMGVVRLLGKQQPDKQYRLAPITETAAQATEAKGQKGKIAKRIFFPTALNCDSVLLLLSPDIDGHDGVPRAIQSQDRGCWERGLPFPMLEYLPWSLSGPGLRSSSR
jgi:hypothetical protein